jgi:hypothetical protein
MFALNTYSCREIIHGGGRQQEAAGEPHTTQAFWRCSRRPRCSCSLAKVWQTDFHVTPMFRLHFFGSDGKESKRGRKTLLRCLECWKRRGGVKEIFTCGTMVHMKMPW